MKSINYNAPAKCSKQTIINAPVKKVWQILTNIDDWPAWQPNIKRARLNGELMHRTNFDWMVDGFNIHSTLHTIDLHKHFGWTGRSFGTFAIHNWTLKEIDNKTEVLVEESLEGLPVRVFSSMFNKMLDKSMQTSLERLRIACES